MEQARARRKVAVGQHVGEVEAGVGQGRVDVRPAGRVAGRRRRRYLGQATTVYPDQVRITAKLIALVTAYEKKKGEGKFAALKAAAEALDTAKTDPLLTP